MRYRFFSNLLTAALLVWHFHSCATSDNGKEKVDVQVQQADLEEMAKKAKNKASEIESDEEILALVKRAKANFSSQGKEDISRLSKKANANAREIDHDEKVMVLVDNAKKTALSKMIMASKTSCSHDILIFASASLGKRGLAEAFENAAQHRATVVFRGIPNGMGLADGVRKIQRLASKQNPVPHVIINPLLFERHHVVVVPTIVVVDGNSCTPESAVLASVSGVSNPASILQLIESGERGNQGVLGEVVAIKEQSLVAVMQDRVIAIDWEEKKQKAFKRRWRNLPSQQLPCAIVQRTRNIDPTVVVSKDILAPKGEIIAVAGTKINPLHMRPFSKILVVFDPEKPSQWSQIQQALPAIKQRTGVSRVTYLVTGFDPDSGEDGYQRLAKKLGSSPFLLTKELTTRFDLQHTPSIIFASGDQFVVEEIANAH